MVAHAHCAYEAPSLDFYHHSCDDLVSTHSTKQDGIHARWTLLHLECSANFLLTTFSQFPPPIFPIAHFFTRIPKRFTCLFVLARFSDSFWFTVSSGFYDHSRAAVGRLKTDDEL